ncbi:variable surface protein [Plasmodium gonderi]|uniref:Variable surface protein n=1 Tax=Plasmodium gonderi TaxID=77519 RepID=A0A1Y1JTA1_PLAGO|nr:variable surface protein [Plasmodium gonderi]GAW84367.1 variable surface protein [Plasmodium gonderi]
MSFNNSGNEDFYFEGIFPTCDEEYMEATKRIITDVNSLSDNTCTMIYHSVGVRDPRNESYFIDDCKALIQYLSGIENKTEESDIKSRCNYLNYKLKYDLMGYHCSIQNTKEVYQKIVDSYKPYNKILNKCNSHIKNLDLDTFYKFYFLNWLYNYLNVFIGGKFICPFNTDDFKKYIVLLKKCEIENNRNFCNVLEKFKAQYSDYIHKLTKCLEGHKGLTFSSWKYTTYGSYIGLRIRVMLRFRNKKNKERLKLLDSFENAFNDLSNKECQIAYNSLE